ncbi:MAG: SoxR reducing system RseC family protein [Cyclobacteriaceae bacterium]|nr:SoxR reducing system RseC family protein [Cyclobacteriaceae bacterium]
MQQTKPINHTGIVSRCDASMATIRLLQEDECHSCHIKEFCGVSDDERSVYQVPAGDLRVGDRVVLQIGTSTGFKAMFWGYFSPFLLILFILIGGSVLSFPEEWTGLTALLALLPYFLVLSRFREKLKTQLQLNVVKL